MLIPISSACSYISFQPWACELGLVCTIDWVCSPLRAWGEEGRGCWDRPQQQSVSSPAYVAGFLGCEFTFLTQMRESDVLVRALSAESG